MSKTSCITKRRNPPPWSRTARKDARQRVVRSFHAPLRRRFHRTVGFWLGGALLGVGGCILGICQQYGHQRLLVGRILRMF
jgi:hypothetical protein